MGALAQAWAWADACCVTLVLVHFGELFSLLVVTYLLSMYNYLFGLVGFAGGHTLAWAPEEMK